jgi:spore coat protein H
MIKTKRSKNVNWKKLICVLTLAIILLMVITGCSSSQNKTQVAGSSKDVKGLGTRPAGWTNETHGNNVDPNYEIVFPQDKVNQLKITISPDNWKVMQTNMTELFGASGTRQPGGGGIRGPQAGGGGAFPSSGNVTQRGGAIPNFGNLFPPGGTAPGMPPGDNVTPGFGFLPGGGGAIPGIGAQPGIGGANMTPVNPTWVPTTIEFKGRIWNNVGIRYKGNSSLMTGWMSGTLKLPLKLDFDQYEEKYPEINNQRFYGFKQISLSNSFSDDTYMRDAITADMLAEAGLVAAETAYYEIILDYGDGPVNLGLYVAIEVIDDTVIDRVLGNDSGNIYQADGSGVSLAAGTFNQIKDSFEKENNQQLADWSDIETLYNVLHSEKRISDPKAWRKSLESIFDVNVFLEWLAISAIIQNWDNYGSMSHNFYLYHDPDTNRLTWISWDHNMVLMGSGGMGGPDGIAMPGGGMGIPGGMGGNVSLDKKDVGQNWPLIRFLLDDPTYYNQYVNYIKETINGAFNPDKMKKKCQELAALIAPYNANNKNAFESAVQELINRINERFQAANTFLATGK